MVTLRPVTDDGKTIRIERSKGSPRDIWVTVDIDIDGTHSIRYDRNHYRLPDDIPPGKPQALAWVKDHLRRLVAAEKQAIMARGTETVAPSETNITDFDVDTPTITEADLES